MKTLFIVLLIAAVESAKVHYKSCGGCTEYFVDDTKHMTQQEAGEYCRVNGANLVKIAHRTQQTCIEEFLNEIGDAGVSVWTGLALVDKEWRWASDFSLASDGYTNWKYGEPNDHGPSVHLYRPFNYQWNDVDSNWGISEPDYAQKTYPLCQRCSAKLCGQQLDVIG